MLCAKIQEDLGNVGFCPMCQEKDAIAREEDPHEGTTGCYNTAQFCGGQCGGEKGRLKSLLSLGMMDTEPEAAFDNISALMKELFNTPVSFISLTDPTRCWFKACHGDWSILERKDEQGRSWYEVMRGSGWCNFLLVPTTPEVVVIEDAQVDARLTMNCFVCGPPYLRFYAGAPLIGSRGERYGTLCVMDVAPRAFSAEMYAMLSNYANLVAEELERNKPLHDKMQGEVLNDIERSRHLDLSLQASKEGIVMLDMRESDWPILYGNSPFLETTGLTGMDSVMGLKFWDLFESKSHTRMELGLAIGLGDGFDVKLVCKETGRDVFLRLLPATTDQLAPSKAAAVPAWAPSCEEASPPEGSWFRPVKNLHSELSIQTDDMINPGKAFWFAMALHDDQCVLAPKKLEEMEPASRATTAEFSSAGTKTSGETGSSKTSGRQISQTSAEGSKADSKDSGKDSGKDLKNSSKDLKNSSKDPKDPSKDSKDSNASGVSAYGEYPVPAKLGALSLGPLLGSGSFGKAYRAVNASRQPVAVKVVDCRGKGWDKDSLQAQLKEVQLSAGLQHPNVVRLFAYATSTDTAGGREIDIVWTVQEFCDLGTLSRGAEQGWLRQERKLDAPPDMGVVMSTLLDIAQGMAFVHSKRIVHSDLTGRNVLLASSDSRPCGFVAKVADFGMSQYTMGKAFKTKSFGTVTHMPPELLQMDNAVLVPEADVWSFGVLGWEAYHGKCSYHGRCLGQIVVMVVLKKQALKWPEDAPEDFVASMKRALTYDYKERPSFAALLPELQDLAKRNGGQSSHASLGQGGGYN